VRGRSHNFTSLQLLSSTTPRINSSAGSILFSAFLRLALANQSLNAALRAARDSSAALVEEAARTNARAVRAAVQEDVERLEQALAVSRRIAWVSLAAAVVALVAAVCAIFVHVIH
jgi:hypothetical protein